MIERKGRGDAVKHVPIQTTSVVVDLRSSTAAMSLALDPADFAEFLDLVVNLSREQIIRHGGFFDKETGDGAIGHFAELGGGVAFLQAGEKNPISTVAQAVHASKAITHDVGRACAEFQAKMAHGLHGLSPAVGIHTSNAVWLISSGQIRAIGASVVGASRLCSVANPREIMISNAVYNILSAQQVPDLLNRFMRREINIKEFNSSAQPFGYGWQLLGEY